MKIRGRSELSKHKSLDTLISMGTELSQCQWEEKNKMLRDFFLYNQEHYLIIGYINWQGINAISEMWKSDILVGSQAFL